MKIGAFLRDRAPFIAIYTLFGLLMVAVVQLELTLSGSSLGRGNILYIWLLGMVGLGLYLLVDYQRQAAFFRRLSSVSADEPLDQLGLLPAPKTIEQRLFAQAWSSLYARLRRELTDEQQRGRRNLHLVSQWAHHMKTPVAVIDLEVQRAQPSETVVSIAEENKRLQHSLQAMLNMVRLEDFAADFRAEQVDLGALLKRVVNDHKREFIAHGVYPRLEAAEAPVVVQSDAKWLRFILDQLLSNAIKYSARPDRDGQVTLRCGRTGQEAFLEIADNGVGIAPEELGRVFSPFYTGSNGRAYTQSTGMGLYLARDACQRLGHRIGLESKPGQGTRVTVRFPANHTIFAGLLRER